MTYEKSGSGVAGVHASGTHASGARVVRTLATTLAPAPRTRFRQPGRARRGATRRVRATTHGPPGRSSGDDEPHQRHDVAHHECVSRAAVVSAYEALAVGADAEAMAILDAALEDVHV